MNRLFRPRLILLLATVMPLLLSVGCARLGAGSSKTGSSSAAPQLGAKLRESSAARPNASQAATPPPAVGTATPPPATPPSPSATPGTPYRMKAGDPIVITIRDLSGRAGKEDSIERYIDDEGEINIPFIGRVVAAGKTSSDLEQEIENEYVVIKKIYRNINVTVVVPQRFIFVTGEVKASNKYVLSAGMTLLQAIANAGGPTDWADPRKTQLTRGTNTTEYNILELRKNPSLDIPLEAGDTINVPRSRF